MPVRATVIAAFYNNIDFLVPVLSGFSHQTFREFELIIADDGSSQDTVTALEKLLKKYPLPVRHIWQEDRGFRKNRILNQAIDLAEGRYIIFSDADCIPHPAFVEEHLRNAEEGAVLGGRRVNLSADITAQIAGKEISSDWFGDIQMKLVRDGLFGDSVDVEKGFYTKIPFLRRFFNMKDRGLLGSNFSAHKDDIMDVNGFDERYEAPSVGEDTDIQYRFELADKHIRSLNNIAVQYHLYHVPQKRPKANLVLFEEIKKSRLAFTPFGLRRNGHPRAGS